MPYSVPSVALQDLGAGRIHVMTASVPTLAPVLQSGAARLLAVTTPTCIAAAPTVPTTTEAGYPVLTTEGRWGFYGWRDIPVTLREQISEDIRHALDDTTLAAKRSFVPLLTLGFPSGPVGALTIALSCTGIYALNHSRLDRSPHSSASPDTC